MALYATPQHATAAARALLHIPATIRVEITDTGWTNLESALTAQPAAVRIHATGDTAALAEILGDHPRAADEVPLSLNSFALEGVPDHELTVEVSYWWLRYQPETVARVALVARVAS